MFDGEHLPYIDNLVNLAVVSDGTYQVSDEEIRRLLVEQLVSPVRWIDCVRWAVGVGVNRFLEIGPGPGFIAIEIAKLLPEVRVVGLDVSRTMIDIATSNAHEHGVSERVEFREGDASEMSFEEASFDFVVSSGSLHHWAEPGRIFSEVHRVLKPGCRGLISDLRSDAPEDEVQEFASQIDSWFMRWGLRHSFGEGYTVQEAEQLLDGLPFASVRTEADRISMAIWLEK